MAVLDDGVNVGRMAGAKPTSVPTSAQAADAGVDADTISLVATLTVDAVLARVRAGDLDAATVIAAERRGKQRTGVLATLT